MKLNFMHLLICALVSFIHSRPCLAGAATYQVAQDWIADAGPYSTIDFTGYPQNTIATTQFQSLGVTFTDNNDIIDADDPVIYPNDGSGLYGNFLDDITVHFAEPMTSIAVDYPGSIRFQLYSDSQLVYDSELTFNYTSGYGNFAGIVSDVAFDEAVISDPNSQVFIDDLHFGPPVPGPGGLAVMGLGLGSLLMSDKRRRRGYPRC